MSVQYLKSEHVGFDANGHSINRVEFAFSDNSELKDIKNAGDASIGWNKRTGEMVAYDDGEWYNQDGSGKITI